MMFLQEAQDFREEAQEEVKAKIIEEAPGALLASGTGDVSTTGELNAKQSCYSISYVFCNTQWVASTPA